jgi:hypothetical protein
MDTVKMDKTQSEINKNPNIMKLKLLQKKKLHMWNDTSGLINLFHIICRDVKLLKPK